MVIGGTAARLVVTAVAGAPMSPLEFEADIRRIVATASRPEPTVEFWAEPIGIEEDEQAEIEALNELLARATRIEVRP